MNGAQIIWLRVKMGIAVLSHDVLTDKLSTKMEFVKTVIAIER